jgi:hypothetical protein
MTMDDETGENSGTQTTEAANDAKSVQQPKHDEAVAGGPAAAVKATKPQKAKRRSKAGQGKKIKRTADASPPRKRGRSTRPFPAVPFEEAFAFAKQIYDFGSGQQVRRLSLFNHLERTPDSGPSRQLVTNANKYGLIRGNYASDHLELTPEGKRICDDATPPREKARTKAKLAILDIPPFEDVYLRFVNAKLPARAVLIDSFKEAEVEGEYLEEGVDTFIVNLKYVGLLQTLSGAERLVTVEHLLDTLPGATAPSLASPSASVATPARERSADERTSFDTTCFYITPIGETESDTRKHSNLFLENIVGPAIETIGLSVVRADQIDKPGVISRQTIEYILRSRLVVADLSFSNANVFYELALRHAARLPVVQIIQHGDPIPFDINQMRTIIIDNRDIYTLLPNVELYKSEIASQARRALEAGTEVDTPVSIYFPQARLTL